MFSNGWRPIIAGTVRRAPCVKCGVMSSWHPKDWFFRYIPVLGGGRHMPKVRTERICPTCVVHESVGE